MKYGGNGTFRMIKQGTQITENFNKTIRTFSGEPKLFCLKGNFNARIKTFRELRTLINRMRTYGITGETISTEAELFSQKYRFKIGDNTIKL